MRGEGQKNHLKGIGISSCNLDVGFELAGWGFSLFYISNTHTNHILPFLLLTAKPQPADILHISTQGWESVTERTKCM